MHFFALCWSPGSGPAPVLTAPPSAGSWSIILHEPGLVVWAAGPRKPDVRWVARGQGLVIGDVYANRGAASGFGKLADREGSDPMDVARLLVSSFWGRYVAISRPSDVEGPSVFRDPSGAVEALIWRCSHVTVVASTLPEFLLAALPPKLGLDLGQVAAWLGAPATMASHSALAGVQALAPGGLACPGRGDTQIWRPLDWICSPQPPNDDLARMLESAVDQTVGLLSSDRGGILVEVSGGLDSSIVSAALAKAPAAKVVQWLNYRAASGEGDERVFARQLACGLAFELVEAEKPEYVLTEHKLAAVSKGVRPGLSGLDCERDVDVGARAQAAGADTIFTGQGGDMVFFQTPTPLVAADLLHIRGLAGLTDPSLVDTARWLRRSVWSMARLALLEQMGRSTPVAGPSSFVFAKETASTRLHPWLSGLEGAPPGKRLQVVSLVEKQTLYGENRRSQVADVVHPLMTQPLMELCLKTPTPVLTRGGRDRALARQAFAHRLPEAIVQRRTKGSLGGYYARAVAASLSFLRPFLLDGRLAEMRLIDVARLEPLLSREQLAVRGDYPSIMFVAMIEAWVRSWEQRISSLRAGSLGSSPAGLSHGRLDLPFHRDIGSH